MLKEKDMAETMVGSPIYMAPQVLKGNFYDARADVWSFGVVLYQMIFVQHRYIAKWYFWKPTRLMG